MARKKKKALGNSSNDRTITANRRALYDYEILERYEAGLALTGTEIKSVRAGRVDLRDAYARPEHGELWLVNAYIAPYEA
ncbi:MAG TPA: SsrA-binding protein, partial [Dehalococcoidia bacterium]|nr:SsrA-binding protein [Dehalococcoidia bacterium]